MENIIDVNNVSGVVMKKSTWTPNKDDFGDHPTYSAYVGVEIDSFVVMDKQKKEHKFFGLKGDIPLEFGDFGTLKITFEKQ